MTDDAHRIALHGRRELMRRLDEEDRAGVVAARKRSGGHYRNGVLGVGRLPVDLDEPPLRRLALKSAAAVKMEPVEWIYTGRIPRGKLTIVEGRMGTGKTTLLTAVIAAITTGGPLAGQASTPEGDAIFISLEDSPADTLVPRLTAARADLTRVHFMDGYEYEGEFVDDVFNLDEDVQPLRRAIEEKKALIVCVDPFTAAVDAKVNTYKDQDVRRVLAPLARVAEETGVAVVLVRHLRKGGGVAEDAGGGSVGIGAAGRSVLRVDRDPEDDERRLLSSVKCSNGPRPPTIAYRIVGETLPGDPPIETSRLEWDGESNWTADALAAHAMGNEDRPRIDEAKDFLRDELSQGPRGVKELIRAANECGVAKRTLERAADAIGVERRRDGFRGPMLWSLSSSSLATEAPYSPSVNVASMGETGETGRATAQVDLPI